MTKKDYELIARTIASLDLLEEKQREYVAASFAVELATTNPNFNSGRFLSACGFEGRP